MWWLHVKQVVQLRFEDKRSVLVAWYVCNFRFSTYGYLYVELVLEILGLSAIYSNKLHDKSNWSIKDELKIEHLQIAFSFSNVNKHY